MAKRLDPKAKAKREKIIAGGAGVLLLGVLAFAIPMTMKQLKSQQAPAAAAAATPTTTTAPTTPTVTASLASSGGTSTVPLGQLGSLSRFDSKDPFAQQVDPHGVVVLVGKLPGQTGRSPGSGAAPTASSPPPPPPPKVAPPPPDSAVITVNGGPPQKISVGQDFPLAPFDPLFHLAGVGRGIAKVSIAGGSLSDGHETVTLRKGRPLTLQNDADGTQYVLRLLWTGSGVPPTNVLPPAPAAGSPSATTPSAVTPPTGATVTTTTASP
jgi:hypothetical protein